MTHTKDKLAQALRTVGLHDMANKAATGYYHDFLSPLATPCVQLINDLAQEFTRLPASAEHREAIRSLRQSAMNGEFDATKEEGDEWARSPEGQETFGKLRRK